MKNIIKKILVIILIIILLYTYKYIHKTFNVSIPCIYHLITHRYCPGCGMTRAVFALLELDIKTAIKQNLLIIFSPILLIYTWNLIRIKIDGLNEDPSKIFPNTVWIILLIIIIIYGILRNYLSILQPT